MGATPARPGSAPIPGVEEELLRPHPRLGVPVPAYHGRSLPNVMASVARALGRPLGPERLPPLTPEADPFEGRRADGPVVLFLIDGLGLRSLRRAATLPGASAAKAWSGRAVPITTVFPTGTAVALTSLSTATAAASHGLTGHRAYLPHFGAVVELLRMSPLGVAQENALAGPDGRVVGVLGDTTVFQGGLPAVVLSRDRFEFSAYTRAIYDGARYVPYAGFSDLAHELVRLLSEEHPSPLVLVYWDELDTALHLRGPADDLAAFEVERIHGLLGWVATRLSAERARATSVLLTSDHGLVEIRPDAQLWVDAEPEIGGRLARPPAGSQRSSFLQARAGAGDALRSALRARLDGHGRLFEVHEALSAGLFGPPPHHPQLVERIGELLALPDAPGGISHRVPGQPPPRRILRATHGGLDPEELLVPLVHGTLEELLEPP